MVLERTDVAAAPGQARYGVEILLVLGVSLGQSAVYSILSIIEKLTREVPLNQQTTSMNTSATPDRPWLDLAYQVAGITFPLVPALLALYLLSLSGDRAAIGFDLRRPRFDLTRGLGLAAVIGIPGPRPVLRRPRPGREHERRLRRTWRRTGGPSPCWWGTR